MNDEFNGRSSEQQVIADLALASKQSPNTAEDNPPAAIIEKPWGQSHRLFVDASVALDKIVVAPGGFSSRHSHRHKHNTFAVTSGKLIVVIYGEDGAVERLLMPNDVPLTVPAGVEHRFKMPISEPHTQTTAYELYHAVPGNDVSLDDIVRVDEGGRESIEVATPNRTDNSRGVMLFNRGEKCIVRMLVCLASLRKSWSGPVAVFLDGPHPPTFEKALEELDVRIIYSTNPSAGAFIRKVEICFETPFDRTLWIDSDTIVCGAIDEVFDALDEHEVVTPHFAGWRSDGRVMRKRINLYRGKCPDDWIELALNKYPAMNAGVFAFRKNAAFLKPWLELSRRGDHKEVFLPEEIAFQILYPQHDVGIISPKFGASVKHDPGTDDIRIVHYHGQKHVHPLPLCEHWKNTFVEALQSESPHLSNLMHLADRRLKKYAGVAPDVTVVTACDKYYVDKLRITFPNWIAFKNVHWYPVIVFVHGIDPQDPTLDFLRLPSVRIIPWDMEVPDHREKMLSAFVFGAANHVETKWWMKLDADAYATTNGPLISEEMKNYVLHGHKWGRSVTQHITTLDAWAEQHPKLNTAPMYDPNRVNGEKFIYPRTQSFAQLQSTRFTRFCAKLAGTRLPVPSHDTYMFYVADRLGHDIGRVNYKKDYGIQHCGRLKKLRERVPL